MSASGEYARDFQEVLRLCAGRRLPIGRGTKMLSLLVHSAGCDATIDREHFGVVFAPGGREHEYFSGVAPAVVSRLLEWAGVEYPITKLCALIGPGTAGYLSIPFERRWLWIDVTKERVRVSLRDPAEVDEALREAPEPYPMTPPKADCPYCGSPLRSGTAKQCRFCRRDWHDPGQLRWLGGRPTTVDEAGVPEQDRPATEE
jgi:hypothetical protein